MTRSCFARVSPKKENIAYLLRNQFETFQNSPGAVRKTAVECGWGFAEGDEEALKSSMNAHQQLLIKLHIGTSTIAWKDGKPYKSSAFHDEWDSISA